MPQFSSQPDTLPRPRSLEFGKVISYDVKKGFGFIQPRRALKWVDNAHFRFEALSCGLKRELQEGLQGKDVFFEKVSYEAPKCRWKAIRVWQSKKEKEDEDRELLSEKEVEREEQIPLPSGVERGKVCDYKEAERFGFVRPLGGYRREKNVYFQFYDLSEGLRDDVRNGVTLVGKVVFYLKKENSTPNCKWRAVCVWKENETIEDVSPKRKLSDQQEIKSSDQNFRSSPLEKAEIVDLFPSSDQFGVSSNNALPTEYGIIKIKEIKKERYGYGFIYPDGIDNWKDNVYFQTSVASKGVRAEILKDNTEIVVCYKKVVNEESSSHWKAVCVWLCGEEDEEEFRSGRVTAFDEETRVGRVGECEFGFSHMRGKLREDADRGKEVGFVGKKVHFRRTRSFREDNPVWKITEIYWNSILAYEDVTMYVWKKYENGKYLAAFADESFTCTVYADSRLEILQEVQCKIYYFEWCSKSYGKVTRVIEDDTGLPVKFGGVFSVVRKTGIVFLNEKEEVLLLKNGSSRDFIHGLYIIKDYVTNGHKDNIAKISPADVTKWGREDLECVARWNFERYRRVGFPSKIIRDSHETLQRLAQEEIQTRRKWTEVEQKEYEECLVTWDFPSGLPDGFDVVTGKAQTPLENAWREADEEMAFGEDDVIDRSKWSALTVINMETKDENGILQKSIFYAYKLRSLSGAPAVRLKAEEFSGHDWVNINALSMGLGGKYNSFTSIGPKKGWKSQLRKLQESIQ